MYIQSLSLAFILSFSVTLVTCISQVDVCVLSQDCGDESFLILILNSLRLSCASMLVGNSLVSPRTTNRLTRALSAMKVLTLHYSVFNCNNLRMIGAYIVLLCVKLLVLVCDVT